jgi:hypothetical protein
VSRNSLAQCYCSNVVLLQLIDSLVAWASIRLWATQPSGWVLDIRPSNLDSVNLTRSCQILGLHAQASNFEVTKPFQGLGYTFGMGHLLAKPFQDVLSPGSCLLSATTLRVRGWTSPVLAPVNQNLFKFLG